MGQGRQAGALAVTCLFPILAALFVAGRTLSRYLGQNYGWDDWLILLALLLLLGQTVTIYEYIIVSHTGYHSKELPKQSVEQQVHAMKWSFAVQMFYHPLMGAIRASIIMFLFRIRDQRWHIRSALHVVFWINVGYLASTTLVNIFQCTPVRYAYLRPQMDQEVDSDGNIVRHGKCINSLQFIMSSCALSIFMDLIIIPIPTAMVWNLQMRRKTKMAVVAIMSMGWLATIASVVRLLVYYYRYKPTTDRTHNVGIVTSIIEPSIAILAACAPAMRGFLTLMMPRYFSEDASNGAHQVTYTDTRPKRSHSYAHDVDKELEEGITEAEGEETGFGMGSSRHPYSHDLVHCSTDHAPHRTQSVKTGISDCPRDVDRPEPFNILNPKQ